MTYGQHGLYRQTAVLAPFILTVFFYFFSLSHNNNNSMYHYVQLPKLAGMDADGVTTTRNISDTELYKNQFRLSTLRYLDAKNPIPKDERIALLHYRE